MTSDERRGWRVGHQGRDRMYYEELRGGVWERIDVDGKMLMGRAHHVIYFASPERWRAYPAWARDRRDEIIARITSEFREPDYEYNDRGGVPAPTKTPSSKQEGRALLGAVILLFLLAGFMGWLVTSGVTRGETRLPIKGAGSRRTVSRTQQPAMFWVSIGIYATVGTGALALGALGVRARTT